MSYYNWERGEIKIPGKYWSKFKKEIRDSYNKHVDRKYEVALEYYNKLIEKGKGVYGFDYNKEAESMCYKNEEYSFFVFRLMFPDFRRKKPLKPKKKDFKKATNRINDFYFDDFSIHFTSNRLARWSVPENDRAVDRARAHPVGKAFFAALEKIEWTTRTGGVVVGNDEYNKESLEPNSGGNYFTEFYGGIGRREKEKWGEKSIM